MVRFSREMELLFPFEVRIVAGNAAVRLHLMADFSEEFTPFRGFGLGSLGFISKGHWRYHATYRHRCPDSARNRSGEGQLCP